MRATHNHPQQRFLLLLVTLFVLLACFTLPYGFTRAGASRLQTRATLTRQEPRPSPTPKPSSSAAPRRKSSKLKTIGHRLLGFLSCNAHNKSKERELSQNGMKFPADFNMSDFSIQALVQGGWVVTIDFDLETAGTVEVTFQAKDVEPFSQTFSVQNTILSSDPQRPEGQRGAAFQLPERFGKKPQPALISFKALADGPNGKVPADFELIGIGIGDKEIKSTSLNEPYFQTIGLSASAGGFLPFKDLGNRQPPMFPTKVYLPPSVRIAAVYMKPDMLAATQEGAFDYWFSSEDGFGSWRADVFRNVVVSVHGRSIHTTRAVYSVKFRNEEVVVGDNPRKPPKPRKWNVRGQPRGQYKILITAFWKVNSGPQGGKSAARLSSPPVKIY
jgi:hypothetical protein